MKTPKYALPAILFLATAILAACGDNQDPRVSDADVVCMKIHSKGGKSAACGDSTSTSTNSTTTSTSTTTVTVTASSTTTVSTVSSTTMSAQ